MNVSQLSIRNLVVAALSVCVLTHCGDSQTPSPSEESEAATGQAAQSAEPEVLPKLEAIIQGVWENSDPEQLAEMGSEKIQIDFRGNNEMTMLIYKGGKISQNEGTYRAEGDELQIKIVDQEDDHVTMTFDGKTLTVREGQDGDQVDFQKL